VGEAEISPTSSDDPTDIADHESENPTAPLVAEAISIAPWRERLWEMPMWSATRLGAPISFEALVGLDAAVVHLVAVEPVEPQAVDLADELNGAPYSALMNALEVEIVMSVESVSDGVDLAPGDMVAVRVPIGLVPDQGDSGADARHAAERLAEAAPIGETFVVIGTFDPVERVWHLPPEPGYERAPSLDMRLSEGGVELWAGSADARVLLDRWDLGTTT
jgi:hypothetical protein